MAAEVDTSAAALLSLWDSVRTEVTGPVSLSQLRALAVVEQSDGINLRGLAQTLRMLLSSASRLCDRLVAAGLLERVPGRADRREIALHLTPDGRRLLGELRRQRQDRIATVLAGMTPAGRRALLRGLAEFEAVLRADHPATSRLGSTPLPPVPGVGTPLPPVPGVGTPLPAVLDGDVPPAPVIDGIAPVQRRSGGDVRSA